MATISAGVTIEPGQTVTSQTLFDIWANGTLGTISAAEFDGSAPPIISGTGTTTGQSPGAILFDGWDQLWKVWVDEIDGTGCSVWLAFGADRTDEAFIAAEPIPSGAAVRIDPTMGGRWVRRVSGWLDIGVVAFNQNDSTTPSGAWFPGGTMGIVKAWFPYKSNTTDTGDAGCLVTQTVVPISWAPGGLGGNPGAFNYHSVIYGTPLHAVSPTTTQSEGSVVAPIFYTGPRWGGT